MAFTYKDLHDELIQEAQLLLKMALETVGKPMGDEVEESYLEKLRDEYHAHAPRDTAPTSKGRARISCG